MTTLQSLLAQQADLQKQIADLQSGQRAETIAKIRTLMAEFGLSAADIGGRVSAPRVAGEPKAVSKVAVKYRNGATGETWTGRGLQPKWLRAALAGGAALADFTVDQAG